MAIINRTDGVNIDEERCGGCDRVDVVKRVVRGGYGEIRCFTCTPKNAFERLEDRRGKTYGAGESPEQDIAELLDIVEESERWSAQYHDAIETDYQLAIAMFVAANLDELKRRGEVDTLFADAVGHAKNWKRTLDTMWNDHAYARQRRECESAAERVWAALRYVR